MGRRKKDTTPTEPKRTIEDLDDDQRQVLFFQHKRTYESALAAKKTATANFLNATKLARADLGKGAIKDIKTAIQLEEDGGEEVLRAEIENQLRVARWMGAPLGSQADLFGDADRTPLADRAFAEGKRDGLAGKACKTDHAPSTEAYRFYMSGYQEGQTAAIAKGGGFKAPPEGVSRKEWKEGMAAELADETTHIRKTSAKIAEERASGAVDSLAQH